MQIPGFTSLLEPPDLAASSPSFHRDADKILIGKKNNKVIAAEQITVLKQKELMKKGRVIL